MKKNFWMLQCIIFLTLNCHSIEINPSYLEEAYFDLSGIWDYEGDQNITPLWTRSDKFSWGFLQNYDPEVGAIIDLGDKNPYVKHYEVSTIEKDGDIYKIGVVDSNRFIYIEILNNGKIAFMDKDDSITGDAVFERKIGPLRAMENNTGLLIDSIDLQALPAYDSLIVGSLKRLQEIFILQKTIKHSEVKEFITWYKIQASTGEVGWVPESVIEMQ